MSQINEKYDLYCLKISHDTSMRELNSFLADDKDLPTTLSGATDQVRNILNKMNALIWFYKFKFKTNYMLYVQDMQNE